MKPLNPIEAEALSLGVKLNLNQAKPEDGLDGLNPIMSLECSEASLDNSHLASDCNCVGCLLFGDDLKILNTSKHLGTYTASTKLKMLHSVIGGGLSLRAAAKKYGISYSVLHGWQKLSLIHI